MAVSLRAEALAKAYGSRAALVDLTFSADQGGVIGLLGRNGAGKTTTIRLLTTIITPSSGRFWVAGQPSTAPEQIRRRVGVLPESAGYPGHQSGRRHLQYHARLNGVPRLQTRGVADRLLAEVGLADHGGGAPIASYSRGMRQRLGIARALVNDPAVVFLDEPTVGLDPAGQVEILRLLQDLAAERGATVVLSTHALADVEDVCTMVLVLHHGQVVAQGTVSDVIRQANVRASASLRVPGDAVVRAERAMAAVSGLTIERDERGSGWMTLRSGGSPDPGPAVVDRRLNLGLRAVLDADIPINAFEVGGRLSAAFLALTDEAER